MTDKEEVEKIYTKDLRKGILPSKIKGRGANNSDSMDIDSSERYSGKGGEFHSLNDDGGGDKVGEPLKSIEGWIIFVRNIQEEVQEPDLMDIFAEYGQIKNIHLNIDRRTGFTKGYALIEYEKRSEAEDAIKNGSGYDLAGLKLSVDWAFITGNASLSSGVVSFKSNRKDKNNSNNSNNYRSNKGERRF
ncbi:hypothetical protein ACTFIW_013069 [Dictyostelium discoideum]